MAEILDASSPQPVWNLEKSNRPPRKRTATARERFQVCSVSVLGTTNRATAFFLKGHRPTPKSEDQQPRRTARRHLMSCATPERSPARPEPSSPQTPGSSGARSKSRAQILSGGLWRSAGILVLDEAGSGEWCARSEDPELRRDTMRARGARAVHGQPAVRARARARACMRCMSTLVHAAAALRASA